LGQGSLGPSDPMRQQRPRPPGDDGAADRGTVPVSVTAPAGFAAAGGSGGMKADGVPDVAVVVTEDGRAVPAAGVFPSNLAAAAPVQISRAHLQESRGRAAGVILTSG